MDTGTILTSTVIATFASSVINILSTRYFKDRDFKNEYYKTIIQRRIKAYEQVELLVSSLKLTVLDIDNKPYHLLFSADDNLSRYYSFFMEIHPHTLWLSEGIFIKLRDLQDISYSFKHGESVVEFGKHNYERIADNRHSLEKLIASDMLTLHDIELFLKHKKTVSGTYREAPSRE